MESTKVRSSKSVDQDRSQIPSAAWDPVVTEMTHSPYSNTPKIAKPFGVKFEYIHENRKSGQYFRPKVSGKPKAEHLIQ